MRPSAFLAVVFFFLLAAAATAASARDPPVAVFYTANFTLYCKHTPSGHSYDFAMSSNATPAVVVSRNPDAAGWDYIRFAVDTSFLTANFTEGYYAAGYAEGFLTYDSIYSSYITAMTEDGAPAYDLMYTASPEAQAWLQQHIAFMRQLAAAPNQTDYRRQIGAMLRQIDGLYDGYNEALSLRNQTANATDALPLTWIQIFYISFQSEMMRVLSAVDGQSSSASSSAGDELTDSFPEVAARIKRNARRRFNRRSHCSALVKVTGDDIFFAHDTWSSYNTMVRQYKTYAMQSEVTMSGYPGSLSSIDDWYMTSNNLAVTETSMSPMNNDLDKYVVPDTVSEFIRVMAANFLATSAPAWAKIFSDHNSGTYNNQYMVLDVNKAKGQLGANGERITLLPDTFWVLEQTPGYVEAQDMTWFLNRNSYWPSYNIPYFPTVFQRLGYAPFAQSAPSLYNYSEYSRARIFAKRQSSITDLNDMFLTMRYNEWQSDPASQIAWCVDGSYVCDMNSSSMLSIASRGDLAPSGYEGPDDLASSIDQQAFGAIDTKITSVKAMTATAGLRKGFAINGPTSIGQPVFSTSAAAQQIPGFFAGMSLRGVPDVFDFPFAEFSQDFAPTTHDRNHH